MKSTTRKVFTGCIYYLYDPVYQSKSKHRTVRRGEKTIRYNRPCVVLNTWHDLATVLPFTTKPSTRHLLYPLQFERNIRTNAILSQSMTVELSRLQGCYGMLKKDVYEELLKLYSEFISTEKNQAGIFRKVPYQFNKLDTVNYKPNHVYYDPESGKTWFILSFTNERLLAFPVVSQDAKDTLQLFYRAINPNSLECVDSSWYTRNMIEIGGEWRDSILNNIYWTLSKKYGWRNPYQKEEHHDFMTEVTKAIYTITSRQYFEAGKDAIETVINTPKLQGALIEEGDEFFLRLNPKNTRINPQARYTIMEYIVENTNIFLCHLKFLDYAKREFPELLKQKILFHKGALKVQNSHGKVFDGAKMTSHYYLKNMRWILHYINAPH